MTKKERAEFGAAILKAKTLAALRWTGPVAPDLPVPKSFEKTSGWHFNDHNKSVMQMWSESIAHGYGVERNRTISGRQGGKALYSTELLALKALRHAVECEAAAALVRIDDAIAALTDGENGGSENG